MAFASILPPVYHSSPDVPLTDNPTVVRPYEEKPSQDSYYGLLTNPPGVYGKTAYGSSTAITLRGSQLFRDKAYNLFASFGSECLRYNQRKDTFRSETREPSRRQGDEPNSEFFCMPPYRVKNALRLYFYGQICAARALVQVILDKRDREVLDTMYINEAEMMEEATRLAESFYWYEILPDYKTTASWVNEDSSPFVPQEHAVMIKGMDLLSL